MPFYERGQIRIHYEEVGSGFPLLVIPGGGLNSTFAGLATHLSTHSTSSRASFALSRPSAQRQGGQSFGPLEIGRGTLIPTIISA